MPPGGSIARKRPLRFADAQVAVSRVYGGGVSKARVVRKRVVAPRVSRRRAASRKGTSRRVAASTIETLPSPLETLDASSLNDFVANLNSPTLAAIFPVQYLGPPETSDTFPVNELFSTLPKPTIVQRIRDFLRGVTVVRQLGPERVPLTLTEIHRPKSEGCLTEFSVSKTTDVEYGFTVKAFGIGAGALKKRSFIKEDKLNVKGNCLAVQVPVIVVWEECETGAGLKFKRARVLDILDTLETPELIGEDDSCSSDFTKFPKGEYLEEIVVPASTSRTRTLKLQRGWSASFTPGVKLPVLEVGFSAKVTVTGDVKFDYTLVGPSIFHDYRPGNGLVYIWSWQAGTKGIAKREA